MGAASQLKKLYQQAIGGVAPSDAASSSGSMAAMLKYLIANPATATWAKQRALGTDNFRRAWGGTWNMSGNSVGFEVSPSTSSCALSWDSTNHIVLAANVNASASSVVCTTVSGRVGPYGPANSAWPAGFANQIGALVPSTPSKLVGEFYGKWAIASAARSDDRYWGFGGSTLNAANRGVGFYRKSTGWTLVSSDGAAVSEATEAANTSDGNMHYFRLEWADGLLTLYVDGISKVTKATNLPAHTDTSGFVTSQGCYGASADASNIWYIGAILGYWA